MSESAGCSAPREALAVEALRGSGHLCLQVRGESMLPTLWPGDVAQIAACEASDVRRGDIVLAWRDGRFFLHRFLDRNDLGFVTRGDSMPGPDPAFPSEGLLGTLIGVNRNAMAMKVELRRRRLWSRMIGLLFCYSSIARRAALKLRSRKLLRPSATDLETA